MRRIYILLALLGLFIIVGGIFSSMLWRIQYMLNTALFTGCVILWVASLIMLVSPAGSGAGGSTEVRRKRKFYNILLFVVANVLLSGYLMRMFYMMVSGLISLLYIVVGVVCLVLLVRLTSGRDQFR